MTVRRVRTRMYNVGFGDAFLLCLDQDGGTWRMLIDCGVHNSGHSTNQLSSVVNAIIADATDSGAAPRIDVVVATHRHLDHVSGFEYVQWDTVSVGEVWMPFTENPTDDLGRSIKEEQARKAERLHKHLKRLAARRGAAARSARAAVTVLENNLTNAAAMARLHGGFAAPAAKRRYFPNPSIEPTTFQLPGLPEVTVHMLGPVRDRAVIASMDPTGDHWVRQLEHQMQSGSSDDLFAGAFSIGPDALRQLSPDLYLTQAERAELEVDNNVDAMAAAASIEKAANNTSLVFVLDIGGTKLLFPGDAQWGLWEAIMADTKNEQILTDTRLYKVGHHGSPNGTHKRYVTDLMGTNVTSLMSFHPVSQWKSIPSPNLVDALSQTTRTLVRSDKQPPQAHVKWQGSLVAEYTLTL